jgi:hypothetical protein
MPNWKARGSLALPIRNRWQLSGMFLKCEILKTAPQGPSLFVNLHADGSPQKQKAASCRLLHSVFCRRPVIGPQESSPLLGSRSPKTAGQLWLSLRPARYGPDPGRPAIRFNGSPELNLFPALPSATLDASPKLKVNSPYTDFSPSASEIGAFTRSRCATPARSPTPEATSNAD